MNTLINEAIKAEYKNGNVFVSMKSGLEIKFPTKNNIRLAKSSDQDLNEIEILPYGLHWNKLDEDLSFQGLLRGDYGQYIN